MVRKVAIGAAVGGLAVIIAVVAILSGSNFLEKISEGVTLLPQPSSDVIIQPIDVQLIDLSILSVSEKEANLDLKFNVINPNKKPIILQMIKYEIFENNKKVATGQIGERLIGMVTGSRYFTLLQDHPTTLGEVVMIKNTGNNPEFWSALYDDTVNWRVDGEAIYSSTTALTGYESSVTFSFQP